MALHIEDIEDPSKFRQILAISYTDLVGFIFKYLGKLSGFMLFFWLVCILFLLLSIYLKIAVASYYDTIIHSLLGFIIFPVICIPVHEALHIIPYYISGATDIRVGMDLRQLIFYVTAHRYITTPRQFKVVALIPFVIISIAVIILILILPGLWKWSLSVFLFVHATMCAGDFALLNFYYVNRDKEIYTWDDADEKMAYFYEKIE